MGARAGLEAAGRAAADLAAGAASCPPATLPAPVAPVVVPLGRADSGAVAGTATGAGTGVAAAGLPARCSIRRSRVAMASSRKILRPLDIIIGVPGAADIPVPMGAGLLPPPKPLPAVGATAALAGLRTGASGAGAAPLFCMALSWLAAAACRVGAGVFFTVFFLGASQEFAEPQPAWAAALPARPPERRRIIKRLFITKKG